MGAELRPSVRFDGTEPLWFDSSVLGHYVDHVDLSDHLALGLVTQSRPSTIDATEPSSSSCRRAAGHPPPDSSKGEPLPLLCAAPLFLHAAPATTSPAGAPERCPALRVYSWTE